MDHDQRFKLLLQAFLKEFLEQFFPDVARRIDFTQPVEWLSQEHFLDPPRGRKRVLDLVAKLKTLEPPQGGRPADEDETLALIHIEIEGEDRVAELRADMYHCYEVLRRSHRRPVLPLALYLRVGGEGRGTDVYEEHFWEYRTVRFEYQYVGLPALDAATYVASGNLLGVALAPLMRMAQELKTELMARVFQRIGSCSEDPVRRELLGECVLAYGDLTAEQTEELERILSAEPYKEGLTMRESLLDQTLRKGSQQGQRQLLQFQLESKFGPLSSRAKAGLEAWPGDRLLELSKEVLAGKSLHELGLED